MTQNDDLEQLKKLVLEGGWDEESKADVAELEKRLQASAVAEKIADSPAIKPFIDYMTTEVGRCELLLHTDEKLTDLQRAQLFATIKVASKFTALFTGEVKKVTEENIKNVLKHARLVQSQTS